MSSSCYAPSIPNRTFSCLPTDSPACPEGFRCIDGYCDNGTGVKDSSTDAKLIDGAVQNQNDLAATAADLSSSPDLKSVAPVDLAPQCVAKGGDCTYHQDSVCCSQYCVYSTNKCK